jgi:hypothetical protein
MSPLDAVQRFSVQTPTQRKIKTRIVMIVVEEDEVRREGGILDLICV